MGAVAASRRLDPTCLDRLPMRSNRREALMNTHRGRPGILRSESELEVSDPTLRKHVKDAIKDVLSQVASQNPRIISFGISDMAQPEYLLLTLEIEGRSFDQADRITQTLVNSLCELISGPEGSIPHMGARIEQASQTLVPA